MRAAWQATRVAERLGIRYPIVQGAFGGGLSTAELVAAVTGSGGLGSFGAAGMEPEEIEETTRAIRRLTQGPFALNLWVPLAGAAEALPTPAQYSAAIALLRPFFAELGLEPPRLQDVAQTIIPGFDRQVEAVLRVQPRVFSFIFGIPPDDVLRECRRLGIVTLGTATHVAEAEALDAAGVDVIVASGSEAGGHRASFLRPVAEALATSALVPQVVDRVRAPVIAAGGIADGRGAVAALALGAQGVQVGTAFLASEESGATPAHKKALVEGDRSTVLTRAFTGRYARGLVNRFVRQMAPRESELPAYPWQYLITLPLRQAAAQAGAVDLVPFWAGQNAPLARTRTASEVMAFLVADIERVLERLGELRRRTAQ
ncbi:MAG: NAD(P)H-dependent flavin oxidoreductase [Gemmatimonadales bacterium]